MKIKILPGPLFSVLLILFIFLTVQCYTAFKHPQIYSHSDSTDVYHAEKVTFLDDCSSCHEHNNPINDPHLQVYDYPIYEENYSWQYYYVIPWWIDEYYYEEQQVNEPSGRLPAPQRRNFERRQIPPSPATASSGASGASLSKPVINKSATSTSPQPDPQKRHERRQVITKSSESKKTATATPAREKREKKQTKKEKK